jgi:hypothetical protein
MVCQHSADSAQFQVPYPTREPYVQELYVYLSHAAWNVDMNCRDDHIPKLTQRVDDTWLAQVLK